MSMLKKRRLLAFKDETSAGTAVSLAAADAIECIDPMPQANIDMATRNASGSLSKLAKVAGAYAGKLTFDVEVAGSGTPGTAPKWAQLLTYCGMTATSGVYSFTSDVANYKTATIAVYEAGIKKVLAGAMGTWSLKGETGKPLTMSFEFTGIWVAPTDVAILTLPTYTMVPPRFASAAFALGSFASPKLSSFSLAANNTVKLVEDQNTASALSRALVTDRDAKGKIDPQQELVATWDAFGIWLAGTTAAFAFTVGSAGNSLAVSVPHAQHSNVQEADRDQLVTNDIDFDAIGTSAGDDELTLTLV